MNARQPTFLWHDYETFGTDPAVDRPVQFAALRTDTELEEIGDPMVWWCAPAADTLPHPGACLVTGITPQHAAREGMAEPEFARRIHTAMMQPDTCSVGYNNLRFDDEFTRHLLYRNFYDPYEREWRNGNSRWDLIDLARMTYALRPEGIQWPEREPGVPSFKLEDLTAANRIDHADAHDALADVRATLAFARLLRASQPRLFEWSLALRDKRKVLELFDLSDPQPLLHSSSRYPAARGATTLVMPLAEHPEQRNVFIVVDLAADPAPLLNADPADIADRVFTPTADLPDGVERLPLKLVRANRSPMLAPLGTLQGVDATRIGLDTERCLEHASRLRARHREVAAAVRPVFAPVERPPADAECALYDGFLPDSDRALSTRVRRADGEALADTDWRFTDPRLGTLLFRYRARHHGESLSEIERRRWVKDVRARLGSPAGERWYGWQAFNQELAVARQERLGDGAAQAVLDQLEAWVRERAAEFE